MDKKGVLSWPNPTAEKVFFLCNRGVTAGKQVCRSTEGVETIPEIDEDAETKKSPTIKPGLQDHEGTLILSSSSILTFFRKVICKV